MLQKAEDQYVKDTIKSFLVSTGTKMEDSLRIAKLSVENPA